MAAAVASAAARRVATSWALRSAAACAAASRAARSWCRAAASDSTHLQGHLYDARHVTSWYLIQLTRVYMWRSEDVVSNSFPEPYPLERRGGTRCAGAGGRRRVSPP